MSPEFFTWIKNNTDFLYWLLGIGALFFLSIAISWFFFIPMIIVGLMFLAKWKKIQSLFSGGDANPGLVVGLNPTLIAVNTDLTKGYGKFPIVKITPTPLTKIQNRDLQLGDKIATIALYTAYANNEIPHWADFSPIPVNLGVTNQSIIENMMTKFHNDDWAELERSTQALTKPYQIGTFKVTNQLNNWDESPVQNLGVNR
jgi:Protein of unknown function (DUF3239)